MSTQRTNPSWKLGLAAGLLIAACDGSPNDGTPPTGAGMPAMPSMPQATPAAEHVAQGTVNSVDRAAGTVNISHGPVASASWPAMTMSFKLANPAAASAVAPGQRVEFRFTIQNGMDATVTEIKLVE